MSWEIVRELRLKDNVLRTLSYPLKGTKEGQTNSKRGGDWFKTFLPFPKRGVCAQKGRNTGHESTTHVL